jgi:mannose-1-phosphate guanylyltransferase
LRAIILAAGLGTRLRPITNTIPKCLVPINGRPLLSYWLDALVSSGVEKILVNTHHMQRQVVNFINSSPYKNLVEISHEPKLLGTAGTLLKNLDFYGNDDGIIMHGDNFSTFNFMDLLNAHQSRPKNCLMTMLTFNTNDPRKCGMITSNKNIVTGFEEKPDIYDGEEANAACYVLSQMLIQELKLGKHDFKDLSLDLIPRYLGKIFRHHIHDEYIDIGTVENYEYVLKKFS